MLSNFNFWNYLSKDSPQNKVTDDDLKPENIDKEETEDLSNDKFSNAEKAKEWAHYLIGVGKNATSGAAKQVSTRAKQLRQNVSGMAIIEESNIISKFSDEQSRFKEEKRLAEERSRETCLPWMEALSSGDGQIQILRTKILSVSSDERNFVRNPPPGSGFEFDYELHAPVAQLVLCEDACLAKMRYKLVPKRISEEIFWRNYFYRVFLIKQSLQSDIEVKDDGVERELVAELSEDQRDKSVISDDERKERKVMVVRVDGVKEDTDDWEAELQKELSEFELVNDENGAELAMVDDKCDYDDLEREILNELEK